MTWKEIFTLGKKLETPADKLKFYAVFVFVFFFFLAFSDLIKFTYSNDFFREQTKKDLEAFVLSKKPFEESEYSFSYKGHINGIEFPCSISRYIPYEYCSFRSNGVKQ